MPRQRSLGSVLFTRVCVCVWKGAARTACVSFQWRSSARVFSIASLRACATSAATHTHENTRATRRRANPRATPRAPRARSRPAAPPRPPRCARAPLAARQLLRRVRVHVSSLHGGLARRVWVGRFDEPSDRGRRFRLLILLPPRAGAARARAALLVVAGVAVLLAAALLAVLCRVWVRAFGVRRRVSAGAAVRTERAWGREGAQRRAQRRARARLLLLLVRLVLCGGGGGGRGRAARQRSASGSGRRKHGKGLLRSAAQRQQRTARSGGRARPRSREKWRFPVGCPPRYCAARAEGEARHERTRCKSR
jgi:hypothetical protein